MANRHLARSIALQTLFDWDFNNFDSEHIDDMLAYTISEFGQGMEDTSLITNIVNGVLLNRNAIDDIIVKSAPDWPINQIARVDRNVLRIGLYELLYSDKDEVPSRVAINEAIELAKTFGGKSSGRFVNGVLGTVYKEAGQIDERFQEEEEREQAKREIDPAKLPHESLAGSVVYRRDGDKIYFALVHDVFGHWTLSKGHLEESESEEDAAKREIMEEIGVAITIKERLGDNEYIASDPKRGKLIKHVAYFLGETTDTDLKLKDTGGLDNARWFDIEKVPDLEMYDDIRPIFTKAIKLLTS